MAELPTTATGAISVSSHDPAEARAIGQDVYHAHELSVSPSPTPFEMRLRAATLGPITIGTLGYRDQVCVSTEALGSSYQVNIPLTGSLDCWSGGRRVVADPRTAVVFGPCGETSFSGFVGGGALLGIKIDRHTLDAEIAAQIGHGDGVEVPPTFDIGSGDGAQWLSMARSLVDLLDAPGSLITNPMVTRPLVRALLVGLAIALGVERRGPAPLTPSTTPTVRRAVDLIDDRATEGLTVADIATEVGASVRTLQAGFRRDLGTTPMEYLRGVRLCRAHADLVSADPALATVGEIARRWGFDHVGRFATAHQRRYGLMPSEALRREE